MKNIQINLYQQDIKWRNPKGNLAQIEQHCKQMEKVDLLILPEMFTTGFTNELKGINILEAFNQTIKTLTELALRYEIAILGSVIFGENEKYYNRFIWVDKKGLKSYYDKKHLFSLAKENEVFSENLNKIPTIIEYKGWRIAPFICYDLRFPVWMRNTQKIDLAIVVANWPDARSHAWRSLLTARAIENQYYIVGVNRAGKDGNNLNYTGYSTLVDFKGDKKIELENTSNINVEISYEKLNAFRTKYAFQEDAQKFKLL